MELKLTKLQLEETVKARTKQLQEALEVKSRFLAIMSHGNVTFYDYPLLINVTRN